MQTCRSLLELQSPVLKELLQTDIREHKENRIVIEDFDADTIKHMVSYIHSGNIEAELDADSNINLLMVADKYNVVGLKKFASERLIKQIDDTSIFKIFNQAVLFSDLNKLQLACFDYLAHNFSALKQHVSFQTLSKKALIFIIRTMSSYEI